MGVFMPRRSALALSVTVVLSGTCHAGISFRFTGSINETIAGSTRVNESFDRTDAGGQGQVRFDEFPPDSDISRHFLATSSAGFGYLTGSSHAEFNKDFVGGGNYADGCYSGTFSLVAFDDVVVPGPPGPVFVSINAHISGMHIAGASVNANAQSLVQPSFYFNDGNVGGGYHSVYVSGGSTQITQSGCMVGFTGSNVITSDGFIVQANVPFKVGIGFSTSSSVTCNYDNVSNGVANTDYGGTMTLPVNSPVFNLPPGYSANSAQAGISNNLYTPPCQCDFNHDNQVDDADFIAFVAAYNILDCADPAMTPGCPVDVNYDSFVDDSDFTVFVAAYNNLLCP